MKDAESPRTLFEAIYVHWPEPPEVVVYDNNCHAMTYALNREPAWFKDVQWVIDATHFPGHTGCAYALTSSGSLACCGSTLRFVSKG